MKFVKILNNYPIYQNNIIKINDALNSNKITQIQSKLLLSNNSKWYNTCEHKGLLGFKDGKIIFIPRTSYDYILSKPRTLEQIKANTEVFNEKKIEFYRFNELCNIGSLKWVLGNENDNINIQDLEDRTDNLARLVGSLNDIIIFSDLSLLREIQSVDDPMNPLYYQSYIDEWYKEWYLEINEDFLLKYKKKISILDLEFNNLLKVLQS